MTERGNVLLVDDQPANLEVLSGLLSAEGYRVRAVTSGERALQAAALLPPDCIVLDVAMPGMDGFETCRLLQKHPELASVPVVFITAFDDASHMLEAFSVGGRDYVTKPFQAAEVLARVGAQVRLCHMERELREHNAELLSANAQLEQLTAMRARLSAMLVHDLSSPLMVIGAMFSMPLDVETREAAQTSYDKIRRLLQELLELYRGDHALQELRRRNVDLVQLARASVANVQQVARQRGVELVFRAPTTPVTLSGDPEKLDRVLSNLIDNALKYTPRGGCVTAEVGTEDGLGVEAGMHFAMLAVHDTGPGIPPQDVPYVFDPFRQRAETADRGGVGLGLAIVQRLVAVHGGRVRVNSRVGVGSEFRVLLPLQGPT
jgi:two-component system sensor histidine kinase/response regulator